MFEHRDRTLELTNIICERLNRSDLPLDDTFREQFKEWRSLMKQWEQKLVELNLILPRESVVK